jgi:hypothetical protein
VKRELDGPAGRNYWASYFGAGLSRYKLVSRQISITPRFASSSAAPLNSGSLPMSCHFVGFSGAHSSMASIALIERAFGFGQPFVARIDFRHVT